MPQKSTPKSNLAPKKKVKEESESVGSVPYKVIKARLNELPTPFTPLTFEHHFKLGRGAANMRIKDLLERKDIVRVRQGLYVAANKTPPKIDADEDAMRARMVDMKWPMSREELMAEMRAGITAQKEWFASLSKDDTILRIGWTYWWSETTPEQVKMRSKRKALAQAWLLGRLPAQFSSRDFQTVAWDAMPKAEQTKAAFKGLALQISRVLSQLVSADLIKPLTQGTKPDGTAIKVNGEWTRDVMELPPRFNLIQFAARYGMDPRDAAAVLMALETSGAVTRHQDDSPAGWRYALSQASALTEEDSDLLVTEIQRVAGRVDTAYTVGVFHEIQARQTAQAHRSRSSA